MAVLDTGTTGGLPDLEVHVQLIREKPSSASQRP